MSEKSYAPLEHVERDNAALRPQLPTQAQLSRQIRSRLDGLLYDDSGMAAYGTAIYSLSDPRALRETRYVGLTSAPRRRLLQHLATARLWLPDETPWWIKAPKLRPLYEWIRELHRNEGRLPVMVVSAWMPTLGEARVAERSRIFECLEQRLPLLNVETEILGPQMPLI